MKRVYRIVTMPQPSHRHSVRRIVVIAMISCLLAVSNAGAQGGPTPVRLDAVQMELVHDMRAITGDVITPARAEVATRESGLVVDILVRVGDAVRRGDVLAKLDPSRLALDRVQVTADRAVNEATVVERRAELDRERDDRATMRAAHGRHAANDTELRRAEAAYTVAEARLRAAERLVEVDDARLAVLDQRIVDMTILAPFDGVIVNRHVELGEWAAAGDSIAEVISTKTMEVWLRVPQRFLAATRTVTDPVMLSIDATGDMLKSTATRIVPQVDSRARTFTLIVTLENTDGTLIPGMSVLGWVPTGARREQLTIAKDAILRNDVGPYVYMMRDSPEGPPTVMLVPVELAFPMRERFVISSHGLAPGAMIVVEGNERLFPTAPIAPIAPSKDTASREPEA